MSFFTLEKQKSSSILPFVKKNHPKNLIKTQFIYYLFFLKEMQGVKNDWYQMELSQLLQEIDLGLQFIIKKVQGRTAKTR